ncbi:hypothetical protein K2X33_09765 [bacterium]|nr:hypothetical protein [bacterium]
MQAWHVLTLAFVLSAESWAAACCGSNSLFPSLISGQERTQLTLTGTTGQSVADADPQGAVTPRTSSDEEWRHTLRLDAATLLSDRWQLGVGIPVTARSRSRNGAGAQAWGLGDLSANVGWEWLPEWTYSAWRPKGFVFGGMNLATAQGPFGASALFQVDALGRGYSTAFVGALFQKTWPNWDTALFIEGHIPVSGAISVGSGVFVQPAAGTSASLAVGWNHGDLRLGASLGAVYEGGRRTFGWVEQQGSAQYAFPLAAQLSYLVSEAWSLSALYSDGTLLGGANQPLSRTVSVLVQTRWQR